MYLFWSIITFIYVLIYCKYKFKNDTRNNILVICALIISIGSYASLIYILVLDIVPKLLYSIKKGEDMKDRLNTFLKLLRIKNDETLIEMSKKLDLKLVELSKIENNRIDIPEDFKDKIVNNYNLTEQEEKELNISLNLRENINEIIEEFNRTLDYTNDDILDCVKDIHTLLDGKIDEDLLDKVMNRLTELDVRYRKGLIFKEYENNFLDN
jgi:hypothetical protein